MRPGCLAAKYVLGEHVQGEHVVLVELAVLDHVDDERVEAGAVKGVHQHERRNCFEELTQAVHVVLGLVWVGERGVGQRLLVETEEQCWDWINIPAVDLV